MSRLHASTNIARGSEVPTNIEKGSVESRVRETDPLRNGPSRSGSRHNHATTFHTSFIDYYLKPIPMEAHAPPQHLILRALP